MSAPDPYLVLPLASVQRIEASAGTGKTFTLATLVVRLVVERGLRIGQVLAVTYTEAATQELRKRIRERLQLALDLVDAPPVEGEGAEAAVTRQLLHAHLQRGEESAGALSRRLRQATVEIDLAAIFTIHGFCARALREHALEAGKGFDAPELLTNEGELHARLAADLWRVHAQDPDTADDLAAIWKGGYADLADDLPDLLREPLLLPAAAPLPPDPLPQLRAAGQALAQGFLDHGADFLADLRTALEGKVLNGSSYKVDWIEELWGQWAQWCQAGDVSAPLDPRIARFTAEAMLAKANSGKQAQVPDSPLCATVASYVEAVQACGIHRQRRRVQLLHRLREDARARLQALKQQQRVQGYDDMIAGVADALEGPHGDDFVRGLRRQYAVALVDEFQDTDARQWRIFERVFAGAGDQAAAGDPALFLIGDPKQAIYGFRGGDVHTYLHAAATVARPAPRLADNFRSRPALLDAVAALYRQAGDAAFGDPRIRFFDVAPGGNHQDAEYQRQGADAPALTVWQAPSSPTDAAGKPARNWPAQKSRQLATEACVAHIHGVLVQACAGTATIKGKPVQPGDIAVLVRSHREATMVRQALVALGIPAVSAGRQSLFATGEARELHALLLALLHGADDGRLRTALCTVLLGVDAQGIDALQDDGQAHRRWQREAERWRERLRSGGPLALVSDLCTEQAGRLLGLDDGERRISNYLQLGEWLQEALRRTPGLHGLVDQLGLAITTADPRDEAQQLRLESDAKCVQIVTLHKSKGLEYPLVYLPFVGMGGGGRMSSRHCTVHDAGDGRQLRWKSGFSESDWKATRERWQQEQRAEDARLLYVGLTRAAQALWIAAGPFHGADTSPLKPMLAKAESLVAAGVVFDRQVPPTGLPWLAAGAQAPVPPARPLLRRLDSDWWVHSFSQLARADAGNDTASVATVPASGGNDEPDTGAGDDAAPAPGFDPRFAGNRYGVALHAVLEHADFAAWRHWRDGDDAPPGQAAVIAEALAGEGYGADEMDDGIALTTRLAGHTLTVVLPEGLRLCDLPAGERRAEIEFQFALQPVRVEALLALLHAHGVVRERHGFGLRQRLEGLMTGLIDLVYRHDGKWYVLDYKSNRLPGYAADALQRAMRHSEYDLQALIYTVALHRWLRFRLGAGYDHGRDFGGIRYLFCRGLDAARADSPGIHAQRFAPELVHALDALFGHVPEGAAA